MREPTADLVLWELAGYGGLPAWQLALRTGRSEDAVRSALRGLRLDGLVVRAGLASVSRYPMGRRPYVWALASAAVAEQRRTRRPVVDEVLDALDLHGPLTARQVRVWLPSTVGTTTVRTALDALTARGEAARLTWRGGPTMWVST